MKRRIPEVLSYIKSNSDCLQILLDAKAKLSDINRDMVESGNTAFPPIAYYYVKIRNGCLLTGTDTTNEDHDNNISLLSDRELRMANNALLSMPTDIGCIYIHTDKIEVQYTRLIGTWIVIKNPSKEIEDPKKYKDRFEFTVRVDDDWCICICNYS
ncbi:MAG: hypothetical protein FWH33_10610 [Oscillospiraceae bacterium]|nr:hypothetical protein [Oscillospiraceae bacterium]